MNDCKDNLMNCDVQCCKRVHIQLISDIGGLYDYLNMHENIRVINKSGKYLLEIKSKCNNLNDDNTCKIWEERPEICKDSYTTGNNIIFFKDCIYNIYNGETFDRTT